MDLAPHNRHANEPSFGLGCLTVCVPVVWCWENTMHRKRDSVEWRQVVGFPDYKVSSTGQICGSRVYAFGPRVLRAYQVGPYLMVGLYKGSLLAKRLVHRLVLEAFVGLRPAGMQCRHIDSDPTNNRLENLRWGTPHENHLDTIGRGLAGGWATRRKHQQERVVE